MGSYRDYAHMFGHLVLGTLFVLAGLPYAYVICRQVFNSRCEYFGFKSEYRKLKDEENGFKEDVDASAEEFVPLSPEVEVADPIKPSHYDKFMARYAVLGMCLAVGGAFIEGLSGYFGKGHFFWQYEHMVLAVSYVPFFVGLLFESGMFSSMKDVKAFAPITHQFFLALAFYANSLLWGTHLKMKKPGWDYDGHEVFVTLNKFASIVCISVVLAFASGQKRLGAILLLITPATGLIMNALWLYVHAIILFLFDLTDRTSRVHESAAVLYILVLFLLSITYLVFLRSWFCR